MFAKPRVDDTNFAPVVVDESYNVDILEFAKGMT